VIAVLSLCEPFFSWFCASLYVSKSDNSFCARSVLVACILLFCVGCLASEFEFLCAPQRSAHTGVNAVCARPLLCHCGSLLTLRPVLAPCSQLASSSSVEQRNHLNGGQEFTSPFTLTIPPFTPCAGAALILTMSCSSLLYTSALIHTADPSPQHHCCSSCHCCYQPPSPPSRNRLLVPSPLQRHRSSSSPLHHRCSLLSLNLHCAPLPAPRACAPQYTPNPVSKRP